MALLDDLQVWYRAQCNRGWEDDYGVHIETLDNPGWSVKINLYNTLLENQPFQRLESGDSNLDDSWIICKIEGQKFYGAGDPSRLEEILQRFIQWAKDRPDWLGVPDEATLKKRDDRVLWQLLGASLGKEKCRIEGCNQICIRNSVYCRTHHWQKVLGRAGAFEEEDV